MRILERPRQVADAVPRYHKITMLDLEPEVEAQIRDMAAKEGVSVNALLERWLLSREHSEDIREGAGPIEMRQQLTGLARRWHELPTLDERTPEEIIGYDQLGLPSK
jgi:antitoxin VapB